MPNDYGKQDSRQSGAGGANDAEILVKWWWHGGGNGDCQSSSHSNVLPEEEEQEGNQQQKNMTVIAMTITMLWQRQPYISIGATPGTWSDGYIDSDACGTAIERRRAMMIMMQMLTNIVATVKKKQNGAMDGHGSDAA
eukprot:s161_g7.t1